MKGCVDLVDLIAPRPGVEPATFRSRVQRSTNATTKTLAAYGQPPPQLFSLAIPPLQKHVTIMLGYDNDLQYVARQTYIIR